MVVKVKEGETKRNKASVPPTGWNKRTKTSIRQHQKRSACIQVACNYFCNRKFANQRAIVQQENHIHRMTGLVVWRKRVDEELSYSPSVLFLVLIMFLFPCLFGRLQHMHTVDIFVAGSHFSLLRSLLSLFSSYKSSCRLHKYKRAFLVLSYALHLICFRVLLASFTLTTMAVGNTSEDFAFVLSPWSIWAHKNSFNGY